MTEVASKTQPTRWLVWSGVGCIGASALCLSITVFGMLMSFNAFAASRATESASDLAHGISFAVIPSYAAVPFGILGIALVVIGILVRRPVEVP